MTDNPLIEALKVPLVFSNQFEERRRFVSANGAVYVPAPLPRGVRRRKPGGCFESCAKFVLRQKGDEFRYVEGFAMRPSLGIPVPHAWLTRDGKAFDITWRDLQGGDGLDCLYCGVEFDTQAVDTIVHSRGYYGLLDPIDASVIFHMRARDLAA